MKNWPLLVIIAFGLSSCHRPNPDFITLESMFQHPGVEVIGYGTNDTAFVRIPATPTITAFANKPRDTVFWSPLVSGDIVKYAKNGSCIINAKMDYVGKCPYRIYCGIPEMLDAMMKSGINYAVEICK